MFKNGSIGGLIVSGRFARDNRSVCAAVVISLGDNSAVVGIGIDPVILHNRAIINICRRSCDADNGTVVAIRVLLLAVLGAVS